MKRRSRVGRAPDSWALALVVAATMACGTPYGIYHTIRPGQTLYRICRAYGVDESTVTRLNRIADPTHLNVGQRIFIPGASRPIDVAPAPAPLPPRAARVAHLPSVSPAPAVESPPEREDGGEALLWPLHGTVVSGFGRRNGREHDGIDIAAPEGTPIRAAADGRVIYSDSRIRGYGNMIILRHAGNLATVYAHNQINLAREGEFVQRGQVIARVGETGRATGPHLHFEVRRANLPQNPTGFLP